MVGGRRFLHRIHCRLARMPSAVRLALALRNQADSVIARYLGEDADSAQNGEELLIRTVAGHCQTVLDVGANIGNWTELFLQSAGPNARLLMVEPSPQAADRLEERFRGRAGLEIIHAAAGDKPGTLTFHQEDALSEHSSLVSQGEASGGRSIEVAVITVAGECARLGWTRVDFLKIDTEGYDFHVLRGAEALVASQAIALIQFEYNAPWAQAGSTLSAARQFLEQHGYALYLLRSSGLHPFDELRWGEFFRYSNFVAVTPEGASWVSALIRPGI